MTTAPVYSRTYGQFDMMQNHLYTEGKEGNRRPSLRYGSNKHNFPTVTCHTNVPEDSENDYGKIEFHTDSATFFAYLKRMKELGEGKHEPGTKFGFEYLNRFAGRDKTAPPLHMSTLEVGRMPDGRVYTAVLSTKERRPRIPFFFGPHIVTQAHRLTRNGQPLDPAELSNEYAAAFADMLMFFITDRLTNGFNPHSKSVNMSRADQELRDPYLAELETQRKKEFGRRQAQQGNGGGNYQQKGNYQNNQGGNNNYQNNGGGNPPPYQQSNNGAPSDTNGEDFSDFPSY